MTDLSIFEDEDDAWDDDLVEESRYCTDCGEREDACLCYYGDYI